ncbi:MAG: M20 metallopeptidase family protein [Bacillota bacterium]
MDFVQQAKLIERDIVSWRREVHSYPELGMDTPRTHDFVVGILSSLGLEIRTHVGGTGAVGLLRGNGSSPKTFAIRADMDALPVTEETGLPFASQVPGRMHACGHDAHVAMALGAAAILSKTKSELPGNVKFVFQPGEEGSGGARIMIEDGALENPRVDAIIGAHVGTLWPVKTGAIGVKSGALMAAADSFALTIRGKGGHGAAPHQSVDPVVVASHVTLALQTIVSREIAPVTPAVITVGLIRAGTASNVIPESCLLRGTVRYLDNDLASYMPKRIEEIAKGIAAGMRAEADLKYTPGYPPLINDTEMTAFLRASASRLLGPENVVELSAPSMGGEDMSYYLQEVPGCFFALGSSDPRAGVVYPNHHPRFDIDENVLHVGAAVFAQAAVDFFRQ